MSSIIDIHVLEETVSRVANLTDSIARQATMIGESTVEARSAMGHSGQRGRNFEEYKDRAKRIMKQVDELQLKAENLQVASTQKGPEGVRALSEEIDSLSKSPYYRQFYGIIDSAVAAKKKSIENIEAQLSERLSLLFEPLDCSQQLVNPRQLPDLDMECLADVRNMVTELDALGSQDRADQYLGESVMNFVVQSLRSAGDTITASNFKDFGMLVEDVENRVNAAIASAFGSNSDRSRTLSARVGQVAQSELSRASRTVTTAPPAPVAPTPLSGKRKSAHSVATGNRDSGQSGHNGQASAAAALAPSSTAMTSATATARKSTGHAAAPGQINTANVMGPGGGMPTSPGTGVSPGAGPGPAPDAGNEQSKAIDWSIYEVIDSARVTKFDPAELDHLKKEGLARLAGAFGKIEYRARQGSLGPEPGVAPGTIQVASMLRGLSKPQVCNGVDIVLAEVSARAYLTDPKPVWVARSGELSGDARAYPLQLFVADCLEHLMSVLNQRINETFKNDKGKRGIFMLINLSTLDHSFKSSKGLSEALGTVGRDRLQRLTSLALNEFLTDWRKLAPYLMDAKVTSGGGHQTKLSSKDREVIKDKFRQFNTEFEVLVERQKRYKITDPDLRQRIIQEIRSFLCPLYNRFWEKHRGGDFTKNLEKYVKWDNVQFESVISSL